MREALAVGGLELPNGVDPSGLRLEVDDVPYDADSILADLPSPVFVAGSAIFDQYGTVYPYREIGNDVTSGSGAAQELRCDSGRGFSVVRPRLTATETEETCD